MICRNNSAVPMVAAVLCLAPLVGCSHQATPPQTVAPAVTTNSVINNAIPVAPVSSANTSIHIAFGAQGLSSIKSNGTEFIWSNPSDNTHGEFDGSAFWVERVILQTPNGPELSLKNGGPSQVRINANQNRVTRIFDWG